MNKAKRFTSIVQICGNFCYSSRHDLQRCQSSSTICCAESLVCEINDVKLEEQVVFPTLQWQIQS